MPASAYLTFANANRNAVREDLLKVQDNQGKIGIAQLGKELGARWRQLSDEEKAKYKALALEQAEAKKVAAAADAEGKEGQPDQQEASAKQARQGLPSAVVKRLVLSDPDLKRISGPALNMVIKTAEHFIGLLAHKSRDVAVSSGRKTIKAEDLEQCAKEGGWRLAFMLDHLQCIRELQETSRDKAAAAAGGEGDELKENLQKKAKLQTDDLKGAPVKRITDFFAAR